MSKKKTRKKTGGFGYEDYFRRTRNRESRETYYNDKQFNKDIQYLPANEVKFESYKIIVRYLKIK